MTVTIEDGGNGNKTILLDGVPAATWTVDGKVFNVAGEPLGQGSPEWAAQIVERGKHKPLAERERVGRDERGSGIRESQP